MLAMMKDYLTTTDAAARLGISQARVRQLILDGAIKGATKMGRDHVIPESEVTRLQNTDRRPGRPSKAK